MSKKVVIIGAGPAGLTAAYELVQRSEMKPVIYEMDPEYVGGISRTVNYKGNRIDIGGHRFFSKSDRVMDWWKNIMPLQGAPSKDDLILDRESPLSDKPDAPDPEKSDKVMLWRGRLSRIFFLRKFFDYPVTLSVNTIKNLGLFRMAKIGFSYLWVKIRPLKKTENLEEFFISQFGRELYKTFFKDYTEKVWGVPCHHISAEWGAQRIKGLNIRKVIWHAIRKLFQTRSGDMAQKHIETSLIGQFMYPKFGPGQMWEEVRDIVLDKGATLHMAKKIVAIELDKKKIKAVTVEDMKTGEKERVEADVFISTMPVRELIAAMELQAPEEVREIAEGLCYRDFITVGLLLKKLAIQNETKQKTLANIPPDNWIYIQEAEVRIGRLQIFNNWSPYMVKDVEKNVWLGLEYFCNVGDDLWSKTDEEFIEFAIEELATIDIIDAKDVLDSTLIRVPKTYPSYFGTYDRFDQLRTFTDDISNLFLVGRNGMHRYNNQDHSMLSAMTAVDNILKGRKDKSNIWEVNTEKEYHEEKK